MYNVLTAKWVKILNKDGRNAQLSPLEAIKQAGRLQLAISNPMDRFAVFRFLLVLLYWCKDRTTVDWSADMSIPHEWITFLNNNQHYFELLGEGERFLQDKKANRFRPITDLIQEVPAGNNFLHFQHVQDYGSGLCLPCCILGLLRLPLYCVSGRPNLKSGINGSPPIYHSLWGSSLLHTLILNWHPEINPGHPAWTHPFPSKSSQGRLLLEGMTLLARRCLLHAPLEGESICSCCGEKTDNIVYSMESEAVESLEDTSWRDPHVLYINNEKSLRPNDLIKPSAFWCDKPYHTQVSALASKYPETDNVCLFVVAFATNKAKCIDAWEQEIEIASTGKCIASADNWKRAVSKIIGELVRTHYGQYKNKSRRNFTQVALYSVSPQAEASIGAKPFHYFASGQEQLEEAAGQYSPYIAALADSLFPGIGVNQLLKRRKARAIKPDLSELKKKPEEVSEDTDGE